MDTIFTEKTIEDFKTTELLIIDNVQYIRRDVCEKMAIEFAKNNCVKQNNSGWQICPKCFGQGHVIKPPYLSHGINEWNGSVGQHLCNVCNGKMIINLNDGKPPFENNTK